MKISLSWLQQYVDITVPVQELCDKMIMSGFEVESIEDLSQSMSNVVVGRIEKIEKHPNADKLQICQLDVGAGEQVQIVTGADNIFEGAYVPAALHDSHLPNGAHIKRGKLRGVPSNGMMCSGEELCLKESDYPGAEVYGILILKGEPKPGTDMREILHLNDTVIDFKITANRPDCQSVLGVAREAAVALGKEFRMPKPSYTVKGGDIHNDMKVTVKDYDLCNRYYGRVVKNLRIGESPEWMKLCLRAAGMRPINNIVDITNYVMLETGQPMHAFDMRDIKGHEIIVRRAADGENMTTLDGKEHTLTSEMLVIADAERPSCLAGIMGGLESEIKPDTTDLFLESAKFRRDNIRKTARALGIRTESSARFEKGIDIIGVEYAMNRALQLIDELNCGDIVDGCIDCNNGLPEERKVVVTVDSINALLGLEIPADTMVTILNSLCMKTTLDGNTLTCLVPSFRDDVECRADLAEEVMRVYGYDHIKGTQMKGAVMRGRKLPQRINDDKLKALLVGQHMFEITTYSFINPKTVAALNLSELDSRNGMIKLLNPLGEDYSALRTQLTTSMLTVLATNYNRKNTDARFFEVSKLFMPHELPIKEQPNEVPAACIGMYGKNEDFFTMKGVIEDIFTVFGETPTFVRTKEPFLHPGRQAAAQINGENVAVFGEVHPDTAAAFDLDTKVYTAEIFLRPLYAASTQKVVYQPLPRFPAVERDLALVCDEELPVGEIQDCIRAAGGKCLESVNLFDVYQGSQITAGKKSVAFSLMFRSAQGTMKDDEVDKILHKIFTKLEEKGCNLRG